MNDMQSSETVQDINPFDIVLSFLQLVVDNLRLLVLAPLVVGVLTLGYTFTMPPIFTAKTQFMPPQQQGSAAGLLATLSSLGGLAGAATGLKDPSGQYIAFMKSVSIQDALIERFKLMERFQAKLKEDARKELAANTRILMGKDGLISVEVDSTDPQFAADLANAYVDELQRLMGRLAMTEAQMRRQFFQKQLAQAKDNLTKAEQALRSAGVTRSTTKLALSSAVESVVRLKAMIFAQELKLANMRSYLAESSQDFKVAMNDLATYKAQLAKAEQEDPANASTSSNDYVSRYRDFKYHETLFDLFAKQYELARVDESREGATIQVLDVAQPPERKSKPKKAVIAMVATLATGLALLLWVFARQAMRNASTSPETSEKLQALKKGWRRALGLKSA